MNTYNLFLASSTRLADERKALEIEISRINDDFSKRNVHLQLDIWEKFDSANDPIRKQNFYNEHIAIADIFLVVYQSELGAFTREEYEQAQQLFVSKGRPRIYLFKKTTPPDWEPRPENVQNLQELESLWYTRHKEQWPWEYSHISELTKKVSEDIRGLFNNPEHPYFSFPEVRKLSLNSPEMPVGFLGREKELKTIYQKLHSGGKLMLINAEGGIGKTTLAAKYWNEALNNYKHAAWLFCESGIINSLKEIAPQLNIDLSGMDEQQQIQALKRGLHAVQNEFLLVLDNLNNEEDIRLFRQEFEGFHWHVLITSRCQGVLDKEHELAITHLPPPLAKELFERYYREDTEDFSKLLDRVLTAINYHTLLTEVFAKNLAEAAELGEMDLATFLNRLENEGLFLREHSFEIENNEWAAKRKAATTDQILDALYDFGQLTEDQRFLLVNLALLPAEPYNLPFINSLLVDEPNRTARQIRDRMKELVKKGWMNEAERSYRLSPVIQKLVLEKHADRLGEDSEVLLASLNYFTEADAYNLIRTSLKDATPYILPVHHLTQCLKNMPNRVVASYNYHCGIYFINKGDLMNAIEVYKNYGSIYAYLLRMNPQHLEYKKNISISYERLGSIYENTGDWKKALFNYQKSYRLSKEVYDSDPQDLDYKNGLAISYEKLGYMYDALGDWENTLTNYEESNRLSKEVYDSDPQNLDYKNGLAISYQYLGNVYNINGDWKNALAYYQEYNRLSKEIYDAPLHNISHKANLANSYQKLGRICQVTGDWEGAFTNFQESYRISREVSDSNPQNLEYKKRLAISYERLGNIYEDNSDWEEALINYQESHRLSKEVYNSSQQNLSYKNGLAISYENLGRIYEASGDWKNALTNFQESYRISKEVSDSDPQNLKYKSHLAISYQNLGLIYETKGNRTNAITSYEQYNSLCKDIYGSNPKNLNYKNLLALSYYYLGRLYEKEDKILAIQKITRSVELYEELAMNAPEIINYSNNLEVIKEYLEELKGYTINNQNPNPSC